MGRPRCGRPIAFWQMARADRSSKLAHPPTYAAKDSPYAWILVNCSLESSRTGRVIFPFGEFRYFARFLVEPGFQ
jgi:hypothetical protein